MYRQGHTFLVTVGTWDRHRWFDIYPELSSAFGDIAVETAAQRGSQVFAWCAMPDHVHLLVQDADVIDFVRLVKGRMTPIARRHERGKKLWRGRGAGLPAPVTTTGSDGRSLWNA